MTLKLLPVQLVCEATNPCWSFPSRVKTILRVKQKGLSPPEGGDLVGRA